MALSNTINSSNANSEGGGIWPDQGGDSAPDTWSTSSLSSSPSMSTSSGAASHSTWNLPEPGRSSISDGYMIRTGGHFRRRESKEFIVLTSTKLLRFRDPQHANDNNNDSYYRRRPNCVIFELNSVLAVYELPTNPVKIQIYYEHCEHSDNSTMRSIINHVILRAPDIDAHQKWLRKLYKTIHQNQNALPAVDLADVQRKEILSNFGEELPVQPLAIRAIFLSGIESQMVIFVLGKTSIFLLPPQDDKFKLKRYGLLSINRIIMDGKDDTLQFVISRPFKPAESLYISSVACESILQETIKAIELLTPWHVYPLCNIDVPTPIQTRTSTMRTDRTNSLPDDGGFKLLLDAYCRAFSIDRERISVKTTQLDVFDQTPPQSPQIQQPPRQTSFSSQFDINSLRIVIHPRVNRDPNDSREYTDLELLAIFRSMRYNNMIREIIFKCGSLAALEKPDQHLDQEQTTNSIAPQMPDGQQNSVLATELYHLIAGNAFLKKLDLTNANIRSSLSIIGLALRPQRTGTQQAGIESLHLSGNEMSQNDIQNLVQGIISLQTHIRDLDLSGLQLSDNLVNMILENLLVKYPKKLELIDLSGNHLKLPPALLHSVFSHFTQLRVLKLGATLEPNVTLELPQLRFANLTHMVFSGTPVSKESAQMISQYLGNQNLSAKLKLLALEDSRISGKSLVSILKSIGKTDLRNRLCLLAGKNPLSKPSSEFKRLIDCISDGETPYHFGLSATEMSESQLKDLLKSLRANRIIKILDISKPRLGRDIESATATLFGQLFEQNRVLQDLNLAGGEEDRVKSQKGNSSTTAKVRYGPKLGKALDGLNKNQSIVKLDVSGNGFGDEGAQILGNVLNGNMTLGELSLDNNQIGLLGFVRLYEGLANNNTLICLPHPKRDLATYIKARNSEFQVIAREENAAKFAMQRRRAEELKQAREATEKSIDTIGKICGNIRNRVDKNRKVWKRRTSIYTNKSDGYD